MVREMDRSAILQTESSGGGSSTNGLLAERASALRGLVVTGDRALMRSFQRVLRRCADCTVSIEVRRCLEETEAAASGWYDWVAIDLDSSIAPSEGVRLARRGWPDARVAVLSYWWSERDAIARDLADIVIHKPLRSPEVLALLRTLRPEQQPVVNAVEAVPATIAR